MTKTISIVILDGERAKLFLWLHLFPITYSYQLDALQYLVDEFYRPKETILLPAVLIEFWASRSLSIIHNGSLHSSL